MRVLVTGATGLIGAAVVAQLIETEHEVVGIARRTGRAARSLSVVRWIALDIATATRPEDWLPYLAGIDAVVNCAGVLQDNLRDSTRGVHLDGVDALFVACERQGVRRIVQISAIGVDRAMPTQFSASKRAGDEALMRRDLDWVIVRPSVVLGSAAYGGSAFFRGLAALPVLPEMPGTGRLQVVQLEDVVATVLRFLDPSAPSRVVFDLAGPERLSMTDILRLYRGWLGWPEARLIRLPAAIAAALFRLGDAAGWLGWRPPLRSTARYEICRGAIGDPAPWTKLTGILPRSLSVALTARPASVQERWFAALYLLKALTFVVLAAFWIATGILALGPGYRIGVGLLQEGGLGAPSGSWVIAGGLADLFIGIGIAFRRSSRFALYGALGLSVFYIVAGTIMLPRLWAEPLGPLLKIFPILVLHLVALAVLEDR